MVYPQHPCRQDCLMRNGDCHSECQAYKEFEAKRNEFYSSRQKENRGKAMLLSQEKSYTEFLKRKAKGRVSYGV